jgi:hypothetical protein
MNLRQFVCIAYFLTLPWAAMAQSPAEKPKQEAKDLEDRAKGEDNDRAKQVQDYCEAAQMEPKNKKYVDTCNSYRAGLNNDDTAWLASAIQAYKAHDLDKAASLAKLVTNYDQKLSGQARFLLDRIKNEKLLIQVKASWDKGDFADVESLTQSMTNADLKAAATVYVNDVNQYNGFMNQAKNLQSSNPQEAIRQLGQAQALNPNGPGNPGAMIASLQKGGQQKPAQQNAVVTQTSKPAQDSAADGKKSNAKLTEDARTAEKQGDMLGALKDYGLILKSDPANVDAQNNIARIGQAIRSDPAAVKNELKSAIRYFYNSQFDDAQTALKDYLKSAQTPDSSGVAYFYLGAALIEQSMLETPRANWQGPSADASSAFKQARKANYSPVRAYVSPSLLKVWDSTTPY